VNDQLEQPIAITRASSDRHQRSSGDAISYADTAITMPAPRIDESEASYAPRRSGNTGVLIPIVLSIALLGGGIIGYLNFAPAARLRDEQPAQVQEPALAEAQPKAAPAPVPTAPVQPPAAAPAAAAAVPVTESHTSAASDTRAQQQAAAAKASSKRGSARGKRSGRLELPLPSMAPIAPDSVGPEANGAPAEEAVAAAEWDKIDDQVQALPGQEPQPEQPPAPLAPEAPAPEAQMPEASAQSYEVELDPLVPPEPPVNL
jgi:hypothetical protein